MTPAEYRRALVVRHPGFDPDSHIKRRKYQTYWASLEQLTRDLYDWADAPKHLKKAIWAELQNGTFEESTRAADAYVLRSPREWVDWFHGITRNLRKMHWAVRSKKLLAAVYYEELVQTALGYLATMHPVFVWYNWDADEPF